jgi:hypothetical protein
MKKMSHAFTVFPPLPATRAALVVVRVQECRLYAALAALVGLVSAVAMACCVSGSQDLLARGILAGLGFMFAGTALAYLGMAGALHCQLQKLREGYGHE